MAERIQDPSFGGDAEGTERLVEMFLEYYGLVEQPFGVTPDPRFLYLGSKHREALTALNYGTKTDRGFLTLIAKPGMGKTTLLFQYLGSLRDKARTALVFQTDGDSRDLLRLLLADLGLDGKGKDLQEMRWMLHKVLLEEMRAGRRFILVIDEAQNLSEEALESVRLLSNFETPGMKLMQIVLAGQPQLAEKLGKPSMAQLQQRVSFSIRIEPLTCAEVDAYVDHRLWVAGYKGPCLFSAGARTLLAEFSEGIPRNINNMCFCAMSLGWATKQKTVDEKMMRDVLADLNLESPNGKTELTSKSTDGMKQPVSQDIRRPVLTIKESLPRSWFPKVAVACAVFFVLACAGVHFDIGKRLGVSLHAIVDAEKSPVVSTQTSASPDPATPTGPTNSSLSKSSEVPTK